jgi:hypothetical protein
MTLEKLHSLFVESFLKEYAQYMLNPETKEWEFEPCANLIADELGVQKLPSYLYKYMLYLSDPGNHNYPLLREFLYEYSYNVLAPALSCSFCKRLASHCPVIKNKIELIYDIGCGHSGYWEALHTMFPEALIVGIDKSPMHKGMQTDKLGSFIMKDMFEIINNPSFKQSLNDTVLIFLSDILHCKFKNIEILKHFKEAYVLINEQSWDLYLHYRLLKFGGALIDSDIFLRDNYWVSYYSESHYYAFKEAGLEK